MRRTTSLHRHLHWWKSPKEREKLGASQLPLQYRLLGGVDAVQLKDAL
jgi:hypothetical protein